MKNDKMKAERQGGNSREKRVDILKGILIVLVIVGHSWSALSNVIFLFHMPVFFFVSGYCMRLPENKGISKWCKAKTKHFMIPYFSYFFLCEILYILAYQKSALEIFKDVVKVLYGGRLCGGVYWFITVLLVAEILFVLIQSNIKNCYARLSVYICFTLVAIVESQIIVKRQVSIILPWDLDVVFLAVSYIAMGHLFKLAVHEINTRGLYEVLSKVVIGIIAIWAVASYSKVISIYKFDMKQGIYPSFVSAIFVPMIFGMALFYLSDHLAKFRSSIVLEKIGGISMPIMYLHLVIRDTVIIPAYGKNYSILLWVVLTIIIAYLFRMLMNRFTLTRKMFI